MSARDAVDRIVADLTGRGGMGWDSIDDDIRDEIRETWRRIVADEIAMAVSEAMSARKAIASRVGAVTTKDDVERMRRALAEVPRG